MQLMFVDLKVVAVFVGIEETRGENPLFEYRLIPSLIDQNPFAQWRNPRVMMRQG